MLNTATVLISDIIGQDSENSAFVYGCFSLFDKCANGLLIFFFVALYSDNVYAMRILMSSIPTLCSVFSFIFAFIGNYFYSDRLTKISEKTSENKDQEMVLN